MIKNDRQYRLTRSLLRQFEEALDEIRHDAADGDGGEGDARRALEAAAVRAQIAELGGELEDYDALRKGLIPVGRLESLDQLPRLLIRTRIAAGLSQRDLAERLGLKEQQIQRYEANEWQTASLGRLIEVSEVLGIHLDADITLAAHGLDLASLLRNLVDAGLNRAFVQGRLAPSGLNPDEASGGQLAKVLDLTARISRVYGWTPSQILRGEPVDVEQSLPAAVNFKLPRRLNVPRFWAYTAYAHYLAVLVLEATGNRPVKPIPASAAAFRAAVLDRFGTLQFDTVLAFVWELGIPVLPLSDPGGFHAAVWRIGGRSVIVLKRQTRLPSRWIFDLLHETHHAAETPDQSDRMILDTEEGAAGDAIDPEEQANLFAGDVLLDGRAEELASRCVTAAGGRLERLKAVTPRIARQANVDVGHLAHYLAYRLSLQGENWWGAATNLQPPGPDPWKITRDQLLSLADLRALSPIDRELLTQAIGNN